MTPEMQKTQSDLAVKVRRQMAAVKATEAFIEWTKQNDPQAHIELPGLNRKLARQQQALERSNSLLHRMNEIENKLGKAKNK